MKAVTHLEKVIAGETSAVTHLEKVIAQETAAVTYTEKVIAGLAPPITHLQKVIAGVAKPVTHLEYVWAGGSPPSVQEYTGAVPVTFVADGTPLLDYLISGNTVQTGTSTPDSPIQPQGTGDLETSGTKAGRYKIPISSANTTTPVYLGEVETTRKVKKYVCTGDESWTVTSVQNKTRAVANFTTSMGIEPLSKVLSTHYIGAEGGASYPNINTITVNNNGTMIIGISSEFANSEAWKSYLAQQYTAGTPVTIWYVLATEETAVVNEPLMRIGDYADTLSMEQAGAQIPTASGSTTLDVETTVKPSEIYIKYRGEAVATLSMLSAEVSSPEETPEEVNPEETEETENGSEDVSLQYKPEAIE